MRHLFLLIARHGRRIALRADHRARVRGARIPLKMWPVGKAPPVSSPGKSEHFSNLSDPYKERRIVVLVPRLIFADIKGQSCMLGVERRRHRSFGRVALLGEHPLILRIAHRFRHQYAQPLALSKRDHRPAVCRYVRAQIVNVTAVAHVSSPPASCHSACRSRTRSP